MLDEDQRAPDVEPEPPATFGDQSQDLGFVREATLAVRELDTLLAVVNPEQLPQDPSFLSVAIAAARYRPTISRARETRPRHGA